QLGAALQEATGGAPAESLRAFLRPHGLDRAATPILVEAIEAMATLAPEPLDLPTPRPLDRALLWPAAWLFRLLAAQRSGKKWLRRHPALQRWSRRLSPAEDSHSGNLWYQLRRTRRRSARLARIAWHFPDALLTHRSL